MPLIYISFIWLNYRTKPPVGDFGVARAKQLKHAVKYRSKVPLIITFQMNGHILSAESSQNHLVQHNKHYHRKVLLSSFHLNGHTLGFHPETQKLEPPCTA